MLYCFNSLSKESEDNIMLSIFLVLDNPKVRVYPIPGSVKVGRFGPGSPQPQTICCQGKHLQTCSWAARFTSRHTHGGLKTNKPSNSQTLKSEYNCKINITVNY